MAGIQVTEETKMVVEHYLQKQHARIRKRKEKKGLPLSTKTENKVVKEKPVIKKKNDLTKVTRHVLKLAKVISDLDAQGFRKYIVDKDQHRIDAVIDKLKEAIGEFKKIKG
jgi:hypothetical protein